MHLQARGRALRALSCDALLSRSCRSSRGCAAVPCRNANTQPLKKLVPTYWPIGWNQRPNLRSTSSILSHTHLTLQLSHKQIPPFHVIPVLWKAKPWSTALFRLAGSGCLGHVRPARRNCLASLRVRSRFLWSRGKRPDPGVAGRCFRAPKILEDSIVSYGRFIYDAYSMQPRGPIYQIWATI